VTKDEEVRAITAELEALLGPLHANVEALDAILGDPPETPEPCTEGASP
jgi:hypothetical protein